MSGCLFTLLTIDINVTCHEIVFFFVLFCFE